MTPFSLLPVHRLRSTYDAPPGGGGDDDGAAAAYYHFAKGQQRSPGCHTGQAPQGSAPDGRADRSSRASGSEAGGLGGTPWQGSSLDGRQGSQRGSTPRGSSLGGSEAKAAAGSHTGSPARSLGEKSSYVKHLEAELATLRADRSSLMQTILDLKQENEEHAQAAAMVRAATTAEPMVRAATTTAPPPHTHTHTLNPATWALITHNDALISHLYPFASRPTPR